MLRSSLYAEDDSKVQHALNRANDAHSAGLVGQCGGEGAMGAGNLNARAATVQVSFAYQAWGCAR